MPCQLLKSRHEELSTYLKAVVDKPLEGSQCADHDDPDRETVPEALEANVSVDSRHGFSAALASCFLRQ